MKKGYRNIAFLAELLINILVFSISCAVLAGVFGKAGSMARQTREQSLASAEAYALVETVRALGPQALPTAEDGVITCHYDESWQQVEGAQSPAYTVRLETTHEPTAAGVLLHITAVAHANTGPTAGQELARLETAVYLPGEGGAA